MIALNKGCWTQTGSGLRFYLHDLDENVYTITDIAASLSKQCRYNGNSRYFYSVAQHSVLASLMAPPEFALETLLHDASEAYIGDIVRPIKKAIPGLSELEDQLHQSIFKSFNLTWPMPDIVHVIDNRMLRTEMGLLMPQADPVEWGFSDVQPYTGLLRSPEDLWTWEEAEWRFLSHYDALINYRNSMVA